MAEVSSLFVRIGADTRGLTQALTLASRQVAQFGASSKTAAATTSTAFRGAQVAAVAFGALAVAGLSDAVHAAEDWAGQVRLLQRTTGLAAEEASGLIFAGNSLGVSVDKLSIGFGLLDKNIVNGTTNFEKYGIATTDAQGTQLSFSTILGELADKYVELGGGIKGAAFAQNVFGRSGRNLIPILSRGSEGLADLVAQAQSYGLVIGQDVVDQAKEAGIASRQLGLSLQGLKVQIGVNLIPVVDLLVKGLTFLVGILHEIPGPVIDVVGGFAILTGALVALQFAGAIIARAWAPIIGAFSGAGAAATEQAAGTTLAAGSTEALTAAVAALIGPLQALAGVEAEVAAGATAAGRALGFQATASGLLVPETVALEATETAAAGTSAGFVGLGAAAGPATLGVLALGAALVGMKFSLDAAHRSFETGVANDLLALSGARGRAAQTRIRALAAEAKKLTTIASGGGAPGDITAIGAAFAIRGNVAAYNQATEASARYNDQQKLLAQTGAQANASLAESVRQMEDVSDTSALSAEQVSLLNRSIVAVGGSVARLGPQMGDTVAKLLSDFQTLATDGKHTFPEIQAAAISMVQQTKAAFADWHASIVDTFGGAGSALEDFANKTNVDLGRVTAHLTQYTAQIRRYGDDLKTITDEFGKRAQGFIEWATSQGLAQAGLVGAVADASKRNAATVIDAYNQAQSATSNLASQIQDALDPVFQRVLLQLKNIVRVLHGKNALTIRDEQALRALDDVHGKLLDITNKEWLAKVEQAGGVDEALRDIGRKLFGITNPQWKVLVSVTGGAVDTIQAIQNGINNLPAERSVDLYIRTHRTVVPHGGGLIAHEGGAIPPSREVSAYAARRLHEGGPALASDEVPAVLQRGEFVVRRSAVDRIGTPALERLNRMHDGGWVERQYVGPLSQSGRTKSLENEFAKTPLSGDRLYARFYASPKFGDDEYLRKPYRSLTPSQAAWRLLETDDDREFLFRRSVPSRPADVDYLWSDSTPAPIAMRMWELTPKMHGGGMPARSLASDEVPAILQTGEFVVRRSAVARIGVPALEAINSLHDGGRVASWEEPTVRTPRVGGSSSSDERAVRLSVDRRRFGRDLEYDALTDGR